MAEGRYANIIIDISHEKVDRPFQYKIPASLAGILEPGSSVMVPFGQGNRLRRGYVIEITDRAEFPPEKMKEISHMMEGDVSVEADAIKLASWMKHTYGSTMIAALKTVLPVKQEMKPVQKKKIVRLMTKEEVLCVLSESIRKHQSAKARLLTELAGEPYLPYELVTKKLNVSAATLKSLETQGVLSIERENYYRNC